MDEKEIIMASDTRESTIINGKMFARGNINKMAIIHDKVIFGSGNKSLIQAVWNSYESQNDGSIEKLQEIAIKREQEFVDAVGSEYIEKHYIHPEGKMTLVLTVAMIENERPAIYHINSYNDFKIEKILPVPSNISVDVSGARCREAYDYIINNSKPVANIIQLLQQTYENLANEGIGGMLQIYKINKYGIRLINQSRIIDKKYIECAKLNNITDIHCIATNANISGKIFASDINGSIITGGTINGTTIEGATINGGTINVSTDVTIGNNLYLGGASPATHKMIRFNTGAAISSNGTNIIISASDTTIENLSAGNLAVAYTASFIGNVYFSDDVYFSGNVHGLEQNFDSRYIRPYYSANRCYIDLSSEGFLVIRDRFGNDVGHVYIDPV